MKIWFSQDFRVTSPSFLEALRFENDSFQQIAFAKNLRRKNQNFHRNYVHLCDNLPVDVRPDCVQRPSGLGQAGLPLPLGRVQNLQIRTNFRASHAPACLYRSL